MFWILFTLLVLLFAYNGDEKVTKEKRTRSLFRVLLVFVLSYAISFCGYSTDRSGYIITFEHSLDQYHLTNIKEWLSFASVDSELGFVVVQKVLHMLGLSGLGFLFVVSLTVNSIVVNLYYKFRFPTLVFFLYLMSYFYIQQTNLIRQTLAVAIGLYSLRYIVEKKWKEYLFIIFIAFTIHKTSIILLLFVPFLFINDNNKKHITIVNYVLMGLWIVSLYSIKTGFFSLDFLALYLGDTRYDHFVVDDTAIGTGDDILFNYVYNLLVGLYFISCRQLKHMIYVAFFVMGCVFENLGLNSAVMIRMSLYFSPLFCAVAPTIIAENRIFASQKNMQLVTIFHVLLFLYYFRKLLQQRIFGKYEQIGYHMDSVLDIFRW